MRSRIRGTCLSINVALSVLVLCASGASQISWADETSEDEGAIPRTDCGEGYVCPFPDAVCCEGQKRCCPTRQICPADPDDECIYVEPEDQETDV